MDKSPVGRVHLRLQLADRAVTGVGNSYGGTGRRLGIARHGSHVGRGMNMAKKGEHAVRPQLYLGPEVGKPGIVEKLLRHWTATL